LVQIFLQGKLLGIEAFLDDSGPRPAVFAGRCLYASLLAEAVPRALLARLGLSPELLGTSGGGQFLAVLASEHRPAAHEFLIDVTQRLAAFTGGRLRLAWAVTENLGAWSDVRKRLDETMARWRGTAALDQAGIFEPFVPRTAETNEFYATLWQRLPDSAAVQWDPAAEGLLAPADMPLPVATHTAPNDTDHAPALPAELAARTSGAHAWGVLRGDVDGLTDRLKKAASVEEHIQVSVLLKQLFAGEAQALATQPEFWRKVTILYTGGDDFAVFGCWDALIAFASGMHRIFGVGVEEILKEFPGPEGKTLSTALALAPALDSSLADVYSEAGRLLEMTKSEGRDSICLFGRTLDWKQFNAAADLQRTLVRLIDDFGCPPQLLGDLAAFYRETDRVLPARAGGRRAVETQDRPWRFYRRLGRVLDVPARSRDFQKARKSLLEEFLNRRQASVKLKPSGRVALDWARLAQEGESR
jgi:CRISPR-associated protein Csm1